MSAHITAFLNLFRRRKDDDREEEIVSSSPAEHPAPAEPLIPGTFAPELNPLTMPQGMSIAENVIRFPAAVEFPDTPKPPEPETPDPAEMLIRRVSWDERRFSQSMTEEG